MSVSLGARQEGVAASLLFQWRKLDRQSALTAVSAGEAVVQASELAAARAEIAKRPARLIARALRVPLPYLYCDDDLLAEIILIVDERPGAEKQALLQSLRKSSSHLRNRT